VRLKSFLEMRGADGGPWNKICALPALWVGLLYDDQGALDAAWDVVKHWTIEERQALRDAVPKLVSTPRSRAAAPWRPGTARARHRQCRASPRAAKSMRSGDNETGFLDPLRASSESGKVPAHDLLDRYHGAWGRRSFRRSMTSCASDAASALGWEAAVAQRPFVIPDLIRDP
jgi:glutamate--cysteine ligase